jgi:hypothetical protein
LAIFFLVKQVTSRILIIILSKKIDLVLCRESKVTVNGLVLILFHILSSSRVLYDWAGRGRPFLVVSFSVTPLSSYGVLYDWAGPGRPLLVIVDWWRCCLHDGYGS